MRSAALQRHGSSRLLNLKGDKPAKQRFKSYPIGFFHIDIAEVHTGKGKLHLFVAIQFAEQPRNRGTVLSRLSRFDMICQTNKIEHRLTKPNHLWSEEAQMTVLGTVIPTTATSSG